MMKLQELLDAKLDQWVEDNLPYIKHAEKMMENPNFSVKAKLRLLANLILPGVQDVKEDPEVLGAVQEAVIEVVDMVKLAAKSLPREVAVAQIEEKISGFTSIPAPVLEFLAASKIEEKKAERAEKAARKEQGLPPVSEKPKKETSEEILARILKGQEDDGLSEAEIEAYMENCFVELDEDQYISMSLALAEILPAHLREFLADPLHQGEEMLKDRARKTYRHKKYNETNPEMDPIAIIPSSVLGKAFAEAAAKVDADKVYDIIMDVEDALTHEWALDLVVNALDMAEDMLEATARTGNPFKVADTTSSRAFGDTLAQLTQVIETAIIDAGITPDTDLLAAHREALLEQKKVNCAQSKPRGAFKL